jgi:hypothetical protein
MSSKTKVKVTITIDTYLYDDELACSSKDTVPEQALDVINLSIEDWFSSVVFEKHPMSVEVALEGKVLNFPEQKSEG